MGLTYFLLDQSRKDAEYCMENAFNTYLVCIVLPCRFFFVVRGMISPYSRYLMVFIAAIFVSALLLDYPPKSVLHLVTLGLYF